MLNGRHNADFKRFAVYAFRHCAKTCAGKQPCSFTPIQLPSAAKSIKPQRNPFLAPAAPDIKRQTAALTPVLKGTIQNGSTTMAIMEFAGQSNYYQPGSKINGFIVRDITPNSVLLVKGSQTLMLKAGGTAHD